MSVSWERGIFIVMHHAAVPSCWQPSSHSPWPCWPPDAPTRRKADRPKKPTQRNPRLRGPSPERPAAKASVDNGIFVGRPKIFDNRALTIMIEEW